MPPPAATTPPPALPINFDEGATAPPPVAPPHATRSGSGEGVAIPPPASRFDLIIASDCLYSHETAGAFCDALDQLSGPGTIILVSAEERWSRRECLDVVKERGWTFTQLGDARRPSAAQLECVEGRIREMGEGPCFVYAVTRTPPTVRSVGVAR